MTQPLCEPLLWFRNGTPQFSAPTETSQATLLLSLGIRWKVWNKGWIMSSSQRTLPAPIAPLQPDTDTPFPTYRQPLPTHSTVSHSPGTRSNWNHTPLQPSTFSYSVGIPCWHLMFWNTPVWYGLPQCCSFSGIASQKANTAAFYVPLLLKLLILHHHVCCICCRISLLRIPVLRAYNFNIRLICTTLFLMSSDK